MNPDRHTVLLVEDEASDALLFQRAWEATQSGKSVQIVRDGESAMAYLEGQAPFRRDKHPLPALIFLDLKLPGKSGFELLTWIRQQPRFRRIEVVVLTGSQHTIDIYRAYELGANSYLVKPVAAAALKGVGKALNLAWLMPVPSGEMDLSSQRVAQPRKPAIRENLTSSS